MLGKARRGANEVKGNVVSTNVNSHRFEYPHSKAFSPRQSLLLSGLLSYNFLVSFTEVGHRIHHLLGNKGSHQQSCENLGEGSEAT